MQVLVVKFMHLHGSKLDSLLQIVILKVLANSKVRLGSIVSCYKSNLANKSISGSCLVISSIELVCLIVKKKLIMVASFIKH